jgi:hypothetical protein
MRRLIVLAVAIGLAGCTTLRPIEGTSIELRQRISSGELLEAGDRVSIVTTDDKTHRFAVTGIGPGFIDGKADSVSIEQIVSLKKRQFSRGKTLALVGGVVLVAGLAVYAAAQVAPLIALQATP